MSDEEDMRPATHATEAVRDVAYSLVAWLDDPHECDCGSHCETAEAYVPGQACYMDVWECPDCGRQYFRNRA